MTYRFVQGITYGPRDGTLGLSFHMSEGYDGLPGYLARHAGEDLWEWARRVNGVSCHVAILSTGEVIQMLDWRHSSGNLNPGDRAGEYGYYGGSHLRAVLGSHWPDPNAWTLSAELAGFRAAGPTAAQVRSAVRWGLEMRARFPTIRGATGHHDQSPKPCPGLSANMKAIFADVGGHGLFLTPQETPMLPFIDARAREVDLRAGTVLIDETGKAVRTLTAQATVISSYISDAIYRSVFARVGGADVEVRAKKTDVVGAVRLPPEVRKLIAAAKAAGIAEGKASVVVPPDTTPHSDEALETAKRSARSTALQDAAEASSKAIAAVPR